MKYLLTLLCFVPRKIGRVDELVVWAQPSAALYSVNFIVTHSVCCLAQETMSALSRSTHGLLCDKADNVCCATQQTMSVASRSTYCLLCDTADIVSCAACLLFDAADNVCCVTHQTLSTSSHIKRYLTCVNIFRVEGVGLVRARRSADI